MHRINCGLSPPQHHIPPIYPFLNISFLVISPYIEIFPIFGDYARTGKSSRPDWLRSAIRGDGGEKERGRDIQVFGDKRYEDIVQIRTLLDGTYKGGESSNLHFMLVACGSSKATEVYVGRSGRKSCGPLFNIGMDRLQTDQRRIKRGRELHK